MVKKSPSTQPQPWPTAALKAIDAACPNADFLVSGL
jgi:hypothetical protein